MTRDAAFARAAEKNQQGLADPGHEFYAAEVKPGIWSVLERPTEPAATALHDPEPTPSPAPPAPPALVTSSPRRWPSIAAALTALVLGLGAGVALGDSGLVGGGDSTITQAAKQADTVTETERARTVTRERTVTETETVTAPSSPPPDDGAGPGLSDTESDDEDGDDCSDNYDAVSCVPPYTGSDDVNCDDVGSTDIDVIGDDVYGLDGYDGDGVACES